MSLPPMTFTDPVPTEQTPGGAVPPGYQVPRMTNQGMQNVTPEPFFTGPPADMVPQVIRREDFPPGPEGDQMYAQALQTLYSQPAKIVVGFDETGNPIYGPPITGNVLPNGLTGTEQAVGNFQRAAERANSGRTGSDSLAVISRARVRPGEAQMALFGSQAAMANGGQGRPDLLLDDATIRNIVTGLGGRGAATDIANQVRGDLMRQGVIPGAEVRNQDVLFPEESPNKDAPLEVGTQLNAGPAGTFTLMNPERGWWLGPDGNMYARDENGQFVLMPGSVDQTATLPPPPGADHANAVPTPLEMPPPPDRSGAIPTPVPQQPDRSGAIPTPVEQHPSPYQYTQEGQDVFLDVTTPDGATARFTGDVVEAVYTMLGYSSFDEMVLDMGYSNAVAALFGFIQPPQAAAPPPPVNAPSGAPPAQALPPPPPPMIPPAPPDAAGPPGMQNPGPY